MLSALLSGVNRAYPYAREAMDSIADQLETLYKVIHMAPFHVTLQGLSLLFQVADYKNNVSDRYGCNFGNVIMIVSADVMCHFRF